MLLLAWRCDRVVSVVPAGPVLAAVSDRHLVVPVRRPDLLAHVPVVALRRTQTQPHARALQRRHQRRQRRMESAR